MPLAGSPRPRSASMRTNERTLASVRSMHLQPLPSVMGCIEYVKLVSVRRRAMLAREIEVQQRRFDESRATCNRYRFQTLCDMASALQLF
jgi:hypothetical protein